MNTKSPALKPAVVAAVTNFVPVPSTSALLSEAALELIDAVGIITKSFSCTSFRAVSPYPNVWSPVNVNTNVPLAAIVPVCLFLNVYVPDALTALTPFCPIGNTSLLKLGSFISALLDSNTISATPSAAKFDSAPVALYSVPV